MADETPSPPPDAPGADAVRFPEARIAGTPPPGLAFFARSRFWWVTLLCAIVAIGLAVVSLSRGGLEITVRFPAGHGLEPGAALRYRGVAVGRVQDVTLTGALDRVVVRIELDGAAAALAREGSRFWIVRPQISLSRMRGLDTVVGARYVGVEPGPEGGPPQYLFDGVEAPPALERTSPLELSIHFRDGHGLAAGDLLRHRGIVAGEVTSVRLDPGLDGVTVTVRLAESAAGIARAGSRFWIERPRVSLSGVRGLETIVGGRSIGVVPGPSGGAVHTVFEGLEEPPVVLDHPEGGLEIVLESPERSGLEVGSPVTYRGIAIGRVTSVGLASDAAGVEARVSIEPAYRRLVRRNTDFWSISGVEVRLGWTGVKMDVESLATIAAGGVAMATRDPPGLPVATGARFQLRPEPESDWREWKPRIPVGGPALPGGAGAPRPVRAALRWRERNYVGFVTQRQRDGWVLPLDGGRLLGPADLLSPVESARDGTTTLAFEGRELPVSTAATTAYGPVAVFSAGAGDGGGDRGGGDRGGGEHGAAPGEGTAPASWPTARVRHPDAPEDCIVVTGDPRSRGLPIAPGRLVAGSPEAAAAPAAETDTGAGATAGQPTWRVDPSIPLDASWHGAAVVSRRDGAVIGILLVTAGEARIAPIPRPLAGR